MALLPAAVARAGEEEMLFAGGRVRVLVARGADGQWWATTLLPDLPGADSLRSGPYPSEAEARSAGLAAGLRVLDRARAGIGKP